MKFKLFGCLLAAALSSSAAFAGKLILTDGTAIPTAVVAQPAKSLAPGIPNFPQPSLIMTPPAGMVPLAGSLSPGELLANRVVLPKIFLVLKSDGNIRTTVGRWSKQAQWVFEPEHWTAREDTTITGVSDTIPMSMGADYKQAVRALLASTALTEQELKPCFYSNQVLRVVYINQKCDRTQD